MMRRVAAGIGYFTFGTFLVVVVVLGVGVILLGDRRSPSAPSREACVTLWNSPSNAVLRGQVVARGYTTAEIGGAYSFERYQGCFASFVDAIGEPWAFYSASRVPGEDRRLRWILDWHGQRWEIDIPEPEPAPQPNAVVLPDGSLSLRDDP